MADTNTAQKTVERSLDGAIGQALDREVGRQEARKQILEKSKNQRREVVNVDTSQATAVSKSERTSLAKEVAKSAFEKTPDQFLALAQEVQLQAITNLKNSDLKAGVSATIDFGGNSAIQHAVGLASILPAAVKEVSVNGQKGVRKGIQGNFYTAEGRYLAIVSGDSLVIEKTADQQTLIKEEKTLENLVKEWFQKITKTAIDSENKPPETEINKIYQEAARFDLQPQLLLAIRSVFKGQYGNDLNGLPEAQIATACRYLQSAQSLYQNEHPNVAIQKSGNYTAEFLQYLMEHYALFGQYSAGGAAKAAEVIQAYAQLKGITLNIPNATDATTAKNSPSQPSQSRPRESAAKSTSSKNKEPEIVIEGTDSTANLRGMALLENRDFREKVKKVANNIGCAPEDLIAIFQLECGLNPQAQNSIGATGLIQWIPTTARSTYHLEVNTIRRMTALQQLDLVEIYFKRNGRNKSIDDLYLSVLYPAAKNRPDSYVIGSERGQEYAEKFSSQNPFVRGRLVTKGDILKKIRSIRQNGKFVTAFTRLESGQN